jgi:hypothetical protein
MTKASIVLDRRDAPWTLAVEPWAETFEIPADALVKVVVYDIGVADEFSLEVSEEGKFLHFGHRRFDVIVGDVVHQFDYS